MPEAAPPDSFLDSAAALYYNIDHPTNASIQRSGEGRNGAWRRFGIILPAAAIALTLALFLQLAWPARTPIPRRTCAPRRDRHRGADGGVCRRRVHGARLCARPAAAFARSRPVRAATLALERRAQHRYRLVLHRPVRRANTPSPTPTTASPTRPAGTMPQGYADLFKWLQPQPADAAPATAAYVRVTASAHRGARRACALRPAG